MRGVQYGVGRKGNKNFSGNDRRLGNRRAGEKRRLKDGENYIPCPSLNQRAGLLRNNGGQGKGKKKAGELTEKKTFCWGKSES